MAMNAEQRKQYQASTKRCKEIAKQIEPLQQEVQRLTRVWDFHRRKCERLAGRI